MNAFVSPLGASRRQMPLPSSSDAMVAGPNMARQNAFAATLPAPAQAVGGAMQNAFAAKAATPMPMASPAQNPFAISQPASPGPLANAFKGFATGLLGVDKINAMDDRYKAQDAEEGKKKLAMLQQFRAMPVEQRMAALPQLSQAIGKEIPPDTMSDQAIDNQLAVMQGQLGIAPATPEADKYQFLQGPDGSLSVGNQVTGEIDQRIAGTPKPPAPKEYDYKEVNGRVLAINKNDPTDQKDMGAATPKGSGANGEPSAYQLWQMQRAEEQDGIKANERATAAQTAVTNLKDGQQRVSDLINHPGFKGIYGPLGAFGINMGAKPTNVMNQDELNAMALLDQVGGEAFLAGVTKMRGTGPLSDNEGKRVSAAVTRLTNRMQSPEAAQAAAVEFMNAMQGLERAYARESGGAPAPAQVQQPNMLDQIGGAVGGFMQNMMGGNRKPAPQQAAPVRINSPQERDALPPGTPYVAPDGSVKIKR